MVPVVLEANGKRIYTRALLDTGSDVTLISKELAAQLEIKGRKQVLCMGTIHGQGPNMNVERVNFTLGSSDRSVKFEVNAYAIPQLNIPQKRMDQQKIIEDWEHLNNVPI